MHKAFNDFIEKSIHAGCGIALWYLPGDDALNCLVENPGELHYIDNYDTLNQATGFVFWPFEQTVQHPGILLKPDFVTDSMEDIIRFAQKLPIPPAPPQASNNPIPQSTKKPDYLQKCKLLIDRIKKQEAQKVVLSKVKNCKADNTLSLAQIFLNLKKNYPTAFTYLFYTPLTGLWMGATPETLLGATDAYYHTMALAGTRPVSSGTKDPKPWPEKERLEQQWVSNFIGQELKNLDINNYCISETYTSLAGAIEHIRTDFKIPRYNHSPLFGNLIQAIHPTPAVCGFPKDIALKVVKETEAHDREYYTGFLGPLNIAGQNQLFVNLRCMKKSGAQYQVYTGGGITADSCAEKEWHEAEMKAAILEKVLI